MVTLDELKKELEPYKNTLVIADYDRIVRLVDVVEEPEDYYWKYDHRKGIYLSSCVVGWTPLKGFILEKDYNNLVRVWNLNNVEKSV